MKFRVQEHERKNEKGRGERIESKRNKEVERRKRTSGSALKLFILMNDVPVFIYESSLSFFSLFPFTM